VVQGALKLILEPIFEADFQSGSYGYRPKRTAQAAVLQVDKAVMQGKTRVIDLDLRAYFDNVQHYLLLEKVARRIQDAMVMRLLNLILKSTEKKGVPQGGVVTPLTQKVIWADCLAWWYRTALWWAREDGNTMANGDGVVSDQDVFHYEPYDALAFHDIQRISSTVESFEERGEGLRPPRSSTEAEPRLVKKNTTERKYNLLPGMIRGYPGYWPVISAFALSEKGQTLSWRNIAIDKHSSHPRPRFSLSGIATILHPDVERELHQSRKFFRFRNFIDRELFFRIDSVLLCASAKVRSTSIFQSDPKSESDLSLVSGAERRASTPSPHLSAVQLYEPNSSWGRGTVNATHPNVVTS
jgi:hypothetical protein